MKTSSLLAAMILFLAGAAAVAATAFSAWPAPFVWSDVALVHLAGVFLFAWVLVQACRAWLGNETTQWVALGTVVLALLVLASPPQSTDFVPRTLCALAFMVPVVWALALLLEPPTVSLPTGAMAAVSVALLFAPATYVAARCKHDAGRFADYRDAGRLGEALGLLPRILALCPEQTWDNRRLADELRPLRRAVAQLEEQVANPLPGDASNTQRLDYARTLAMLGRTADALATLDAPFEAKYLGEVENLRGTIYEAREEFALALLHYQAASQSWQSQPADAASFHGRVRALTGVAYAQRKQGDYAHAEQTYRQLIELAPTADNHFLLAQFYEDTQQADWTREHALQAKQMAPSRYGKAADTLMNKVAVYHFGCLSRSRADSPVR
jgi:tetratricopeptide (TPR) repeat protein